MREERWRHTWRGAMGTGAFASHVVFGDLTVDLRARRAFACDTEIRLTRREFDVLAILVSRPEWVFTPRNLAHDDDHGFSSSIPVHISHLRRKLEHAGLANAIETVRGVGYRLTLPTCGGGQPQILGFPFIGRARELGALHEALSALPDAAGVVLISGDAGIGKTTLMRGFERLLMREPGTTASIWATCDGNGSPEYWPWRQVLEALPPPERPDPVSEQLLASLLGRRDQPTEPHAGDRMAVFEAVRRRLIEASDRASRVVFIDDVHQADKPSVELFRYIARRMTDVHTLIVASVRDDCVSGDWLAEALGDISRQAGARVLPLRGLGENEIAELISALAPEADAGRLSPRIFELSEGNPLVAGETLQAIRDMGTHEIDELKDVQPTLAFRALVQDRTARMPAESLDILLKAAVVGTVFDISYAVLILQNDTQSALSLLDPPLLQRMIVDDECPSSYRFTHPFTREVLYDSIPLAERTQLHGLAGDWYRTVAARDERSVAKMAHHYSHAAASGRHREAVACLAHNASIAMRHFGYERAARELNSALAILASEDVLRRADLWRIRLTERLGDCLAALNRQQEAWECYRKVAEEIGPDRGLLTAHISTKLARTAMDSRRLGDGLVALARGEHALAATDAMGDAWVRARIDLRIQRAWYQYFSGEPEDPLELEAELRGDVERTGGPPQASALFGCLVALDWSQNRHFTSPTGRDWARLHWELVRHIPSPSVRGSALGMYGAALLFAREPARAEPKSRESLELARRANDPHMQSLTLCHLAVIARHRGDVDEVESMSSEIVRLSADQSWTELAGSACGNLAWVALMRGDDSAVETKGREGILLMSAVPPFPMRWCARWPLLVLHLRRDQLLEAVADARDMLGPLRQAHPEKVDAHLEKGVRAWDDDDAGAARRELEAAAKLAALAGYTPCKAKC